MKAFEREIILGFSTCNSVVFLYPALKVSKNRGEAICEVCRQPWKDRKFHVGCVRSEQVERAQTDNDHLLGSRLMEGERRSWKLVHTSDTSEGTDFICGNCGFNLGEECNEFVRHALEYWPRFSVLGIWISR